MRSDLCILVPHYTAPDWEFQNVTVEQECIQKDDSGITAFLFTFFPHIILRVYLLPVDYRRSV